MPGVWMPARFAALIIAHGGVITVEQLRGFVGELGVYGQVRKPGGGSNGDRRSSLVRKRMAWLVREDLVVAVEGGWEAVDLGELAEFVADALDPDAWDDTNDDVDGSEDGGR